MTSESEEYYERRWVFFGAGELLEGIEQVGISHRAVPHRTIERGKKGCYALLLQRGRVL
jgi:hypothetical protein